MKIYELRLKNCKSYEDKTIQFQEGINFISGVNGAGKTTIIEAIGLVLFNRLPYNARQFVRDGKNSGEVEVLMEARDERLYRIIRKFNKTSKSLKWEVYDEETGAALDELHGSEDVSRWIKESIGVDPEDSLERIFEQVIAVDQGLFTAPFLETSANRKRTFDQILKVEGYREAFDKSSSLRKYIEGEEKVLKVKIQQLEIEVLKAPALEEEIAKKLAEEREKREAFAVARLKKQELEEKETRWAKLKEASEAKKSEKRLLEEKRSSLEETAQSLTKQKEESETARRALEETGEAYARYQQNQVELKKWEGKKKEKDSLKVKLEKHIRTHSIEERGIHVEAENNRVREEELTDRLAGLHKEREAITRKAAVAEEDLQAVRAWGDRAKGAGSPYDALGDWFLDKGRLVREAHTHLQVSEELAAQIRESWEKLKDIPKMEKALTGAAALLEKGEGLLKEKSALEARKEALKQNEAHLQEGRCPIIQEPCPSTKVAGDLSGYFARELEEIETGLRELEVQLEGLREQRELHEGLKTRLDLARDEKNRLEGLEKTREGRLKELRLLLASLPLKEMQQLIHEGQGGYRGLEGLAVEANSWLAGREFISQEPFAGGGLDGRALTILLAELEGAPLEDAGLLRAWLTAWDQLESEGERWLEKGREEAAKMTEWLRALYQEAHLHRQRIKQEEQYCLEEGKTHTGQLEEVRKKKEELGRRRNSLAALLEEVNRLQGELEEYAPVEDRVDGLKKALEKDQKDYDTYRENRQTAGRLDKVQQELQACRGRAREVKEKLEVVVQELAELLRSYDPEKHQELKEELKGVDALVTELSFVLKQMKKDIEGLEEQLTDVRKKREEWQDSRRRLLVKEKTRELAQIIRDVLKKAADPIAQVYRRHLSQQANEIYRHVSNDNVQVEWAAEYELQLKDNYGSRERTRVFKQLSGGEQMTAALAIRLALMKMLSDVKVGFFDEPTTNLDTARRQNLAATIQNSTRGFDQIFVISHDDAFDALTENTISLEKDQGEGTRVQAG